MTPYNLADALRGVHEPFSALLARERVLGAAGRAALGDDVDHATCRFGAIERRCCRSFEDLDVLDLRRIEVVETRDDAGTERLHRKTRARLVIDADAVDIDERIARQ